MAGGVGQTPLIAVSLLDRTAATVTIPTKLVAVHSIQAAVADAAPLMTDLKVFIVEDSPVIRENLVGALEELAPIQVVGTADDESSAVRWLSTRENLCDLVIVDIFLRGGSGLGVLRSAMSMHKRMQLVVLSNYATPDMRRKCLDLGASRLQAPSLAPSLLLFCRGSFAITPSAVRCSERLHTTCFKDPSDFPGINSNVRSIRTFNSASALR